jgi:MoaA/NifB/PqqE/SkfB family radical SAM enzyme
MDEVIVSLNYTTPELYARHMETSPRNFERALEGTRRLRELPIPEGKQRPSIVLQFTLHGPTRFEVPRMMEIADDLGADRVLIRDLYRVADEMRVPEADKPRVREELREALRADRGRGRLHISLPEEGLDEPWEEHLRSLAESAGTPPDERTPNEFCHMPWYSVAIRGNGDVFICCMLMIEEEAKPLGNLNEQSLAELWHGSALTTIRREMERVMICDTHLDPGRQGFEFLFPICTQHRACPLAFSLSPPEFYDEAEAIHRRKRRSLRGMLTRLRHGSRRRGG